MAFYGLTVKGNASEEVSIPEGALLTFTNICLTHAKDGESAIVHCEVEMEDEEAEKVEMKSFVICKLVAGKTDQMRVSLKLFSHEQSKITVKGSGEVHLIGSLAQDPTYFGDEDMSDDEDMDEETMRAMMQQEESDEEEEEEAVPSLVPQPKQQQKGGKPQQQQGQAQPKGGKPQQQQQPKQQQQQKGGQPQQQQQKKRPSEQQNGGKKQKVERKQ